MPSSSFFDFLRNNPGTAAPDGDAAASPAPDPSAAPAPATPPATPPADYNEFIKRLLTATNANIDAQRPLSGRGLLNLLTGNDRASAVANTNAAAPTAWDQFKQAQAASQNAQLGSARDFASTGALANTNIDPANPMASVPALTSAYGGVLNGSPAATPAAPGTTPPGGMPPAAQINPVQAQRANLLRMAKFSQMQGNAQGAVDFYKQANAGVPADTVTAPNGAVADGATGLPVNSGVGALLASRAGGVAKAESDAKLPATLAAQSHQGGVDIGVHSANANTDSAHTLVNGVDTTTGLPVTRTQADLLHGGTSSFAASNPFFDGQQAELKEGRAQAASADQGLQLAQEVRNAAHGLYTGKGANSAQDFRKMALAASQLTGVPVDPSIMNDASKFEQLKYTGQQLVAVATKQLGSRVAGMIYNQIAQVKPGDVTSMKGLSDIIDKQIIPALSRDKAVFKGTSSYYQHNPMKNDAATVVGGQNPIERFRVKNANEALPGDYFIHPLTGELRQRPVN